MANEVTDIQYAKLRLAIQKMQPEDGDIFTIRMPEDTDAEMIQQFATQLQPKLPDGVNLLILRSDVQVDIIPETDLNKMGYFRHVSH